MISIVCVYNNEDVLNSYLLKSLKDQIGDYELILLDNTKNRFNSAAEALNHGGKTVKNEYIMFVHQDMELSSKTWIYDAENILNSLKNLGIAGVAGRSKDKRWTITNIKDGIPSRQISPETIENPVKVQTLDECLIIIPKTIFKTLKFDEDVCDDWHLYAVDYSLSVKNMGFDVYVIPMFAYHRSHGYSLSKTYYQTLKKLLEKHGKKYKLVLTTMGNWSVNYPLILQRYFYSFKNRIYTFLNR